MLRNWVLKSWICIVLLHVHFLQFFQKDFQEANPLFYPKFHKIKKLKYNSQIPFKSSNPVPISPPLFILAFSFSLNGLNK